MQDKLQRMQELKDQLNRAAYAYYTLDEPVMADVQYDRLYDELLALEKETGTIRIPEAQAYQSPVEHGQGAE